uniref:Uncharacterized protein n=1 Tax=Utricularia reniformis TaxID=192314 RepID=A0A1Y0B2Z2_9LAMI|nr:hypothetical protein AEK19_MT1587 [Utricularia reniformis]ART31771.1 hypothetical protein AEK19_MT1587 [Utricularia reniformis]
MLTSLSYKPQNPLLFLLQKLCFQKLLSATTELTVLYLDDLFLPERQGGPIGFQSYGFPLVVGVSLTKGVADRALAEAACLSRDVSLLRDYYR